MAKLIWDGVGERTFETGVDHGVLYIPDSGGVYATGVAWNGLTTVTESPSGAEANPQYADNIKYLNLFSAEELGLTIEAFTYPPEFEQFDGLAVPTPGVSIGQQSRKSFGFAYRTLKGNDLEGTDFGYKLHLVYGATASPSEKPYGTVNDSPEVINFSWEITTIPVAVTDHKPTSVLTIDSTQVDADILEALELILYGDDAVAPRLPLPDEIIAMFEGSITEVTPTTPAFTASTGAIVLPAITGIQWKRMPQNANVSGTYTIPTPGASQIIKATALPGYVLAPGSDDDHVFKRDA